MRLKLVDGFAIFDHISFLLDFLANIQILVLDEENLNMSNDQ